MSIPKLMLLIIFAVIWNHQANIWKSVFLLSHVWNQFLSWGSQHFETETTINATVYVHPCTLCIRTNFPFIDWQLSKPIPKSLLCDNNKLLQHAVFSTNELILPKLLMFDNYYTLCGHAHEDCYAHLNFSSRVTALTPDDYWSSWMGAKWGLITAIIWP